MPDRQGRSLITHIVLLGLMGSGKTTIGRQLAARLQRPFFDSDDGIRSAVGQDAAEVAAADGVSALHAIEAKLLLDTLQHPQPAVIAAAASVVEDAACRAALAPHTCVWLDTDVATLAERQAGAGHRRALEDTMAELLDMKQRREPHCAGLAAIRIDTTKTDPAKALALTLAALESPDPPPDQHD